MDQKPDVAELPSLISWNLELLCCPACDGELALTRTKHSLSCQGCGHEFLSDNGLPRLFWPNEWDGRPDVTESVKAFYEENPFPNYEGLETFGDLVTKGNANPFSLQLLRSIGYNKTILECGCGTGQLSHYLQLNNNNVLGIDMSLSSLELALEFKRQNQLRRCGFAQMNIFATKHSTW